jgi:hypothetical protein
VKEPEVRSLLQRPARRTGGYADLNPTSLEGPLYSAAVTNRQHWKVVTVSGDSDDPNRSSLVDAPIAWQMLRSWSRAGSCSRPEQQARRYTFRATRTLATFFSMTGSVEIPYCPEGQRCKWTATKKK